MYYMYAQVQSISTCMIQSHKKNGFYLLFNVKNRVKYNNVKRLLGWDPICVHIRYYWQVYVLKFWLGDQL